MIIPRWLLFQAELCKPIRECGRFVGRRVEKIVLALCAIGEVRRLGDQNHTAQAIWLRGKGKGTKQPTIGGRISSAGASLSRMSGEGPERVSRERPPSVAREGGREERKERERE